MENWPEGLADVDTERTSNPLEKIIRLYNTAIIKHLSNIQGE